VKERRGKIEGKFDNDCVNILLLYIKLNVYSALRFLSRRIFDLLKKDPELMLWIY